MTDTATLSSLYQDLRAIVGAEGVISEPDDLLSYECDALTLVKTRPEAVVFPRDTAQAAAVIRVLNRHGVSFVPRGSGTSLSAGTLAMNGTVQICTSRMNRILEIDYRNRQVRVQAGVINLYVSNAVASRGYFYAPDPSSQTSCTIGGNIAYNSGGPHTLKYGVTLNHVLGVTLVTSDGQIVEAGGGAEDPIGYDLTGVIVGSEGTFGLVTEAVLKIIPVPEGNRTMLAAFDTVSDAINCVSDMIGEGIVPVALEFMDQTIVRIVEDSEHFGLPRDAGAVLVIEIEGFEVALNRQAERVMDMCRKHRAIRMDLAKSPQERLALWACRKRAFGALGRLTRSYLTQDGVVPRTRLPEILEYVNQMSQEYDVRIANVAHAGDGNIHPVLLFDDRDPDTARRALQAGGKILSRCIELGGSATGEHGIGVEKIAYLERMFTPDDLNAMRMLRDVFDPRGRANPQKVLGGPDVPEVFGAMTGASPSALRRFHN